MGKTAELKQIRTTVNDHIKELQLRFTVCVLSLTAAGGLVYLFYGQILNVLSYPLGESLYYSTPAGSFTFVMKICLTGALLVTIPVIVYNIIMFIRPAFGDLVTRKRVFSTTLTSTFLSISGALFAYFIILPGTLMFFKGFQVKNLNALISADNYLGFVTNIIMMFIIVFQIPLIMMFIDKIKPLQPRKLLKLEKWVVIGSLAIALLAPFTYDLVTSLLLALPIIVLYNLSIFIILFRHYRLRIKAKKAVYATIAKPITPATTATFWPELSFDNFSDELLVIEKPQPISTLPTGNSIMDIRRKTKPQTDIRPAAWVEERKAQRAAMLTRQSHVHVFSDFRRTATN